MARTRWDSWRCSNRCICGREVTKKEMARVTNSSYLAWDFLSFIWQVLHLEKPLSLQRRLSSVPTPGQRGWADGRGMFFYCALFCLLVLGPRLTLATPNGKLECKGVCMIQSVKVSLRELRAGQRRTKNGHGKYSWECSRKQAVCWAWRTTGYSSCLCKIMRCLRQTHSLAWYSWLCNVPSLASQFTQCVICVHSSYSYLALTILHHGCIHSLHGLANSAPPLWCVSYLCLWPVCSFHRL